MLRHGGYSSNYSSGPRSNNIISYVENYLLVGYVNAIKFIMNYIIINSFNLKNSIQLFNNFIVS